MAAFAWDWSILGRWPFAAGKVMLFPLLGIENENFVSLGTGTDSIPASAWNRLSVEAGWGMDAHLSEDIFLRIDALWGIRLPSAAESRDYAEAYSAAVNENFDAKFYQCLKMRVAVGRIVR
jgi:hypothetical protein